MSDEQAGRIWCLMAYCRYNKGGRCIKKRIHIIDGRCHDMQLRYEMFKGVKGRIVCSVISCPYNKNKKCIKDEIAIDGVKCSGWREIYNEEA